jgi:hypothetical protein
MFMCLAGSLLNSREGGPVRCDGRGKFAESSAGKGQWKRGQS